LRLVDVVFSREAIEPNFNNTSSPIHRGIFSSHAIIAILYFLRITIAYSWISVFHGASLSIQNASSTPPSFTGQHPTTIPRSQPYDGTLVCTPSRPFHTGITNQIFCGVLVSRGGGITSASLDRWNAILCSPPKRITTRGTRHGKRDPHSGTPHMRRPKPSIECVQLAGMVMCRLAVLQGFRACGSSPSRLQKKASASIPTKTSPQANYCHLLNLIAILYSCGWRVSHLLQ
jgi:hypothetical protein